MKRAAPEAFAPPHAGMASRLLSRLQTSWRGSTPSFGHSPSRLVEPGSSYQLAELAKLDIQRRFKRGDRPTARDYFDRYPELARVDGHALSLIYEEFCLLAESGGDAEASEFCRRYPTWADSLASQLSYHRVLSRAVEPLVPRTVFPAVGDRFGDYELARLIGTGGAARVYLGKDSSLGGKEFVLKVSVARGVEPAIMGRLDHPNIVKVLSTRVDPDSGLRGLSMPYHPGPSLDKLIEIVRREGRPASARALRDLVTRDGGGRSSTWEGNLAWSGFPDRGTYADAVAWVGSKIALGLAHAHGKGFCHRDVKPENILLTEGAGPQLLDFNLAHGPDLAEEARNAQRGGTLPYMASEQLHAFLNPTDWGEVGPAADLFSLALVLRELLTGTAPVRPPDGASLPRAIGRMLDERAAPLAPIRRANPHVSHALAAVIERCQAERPEARYPSATVFAADLSRTIGRSAPIFVTNPSRKEIWRHRLIRRRVPVLISCLVAFLLIGGAVTAKVRRDLSSREDLRKRVAERSRQVGAVRDVLRQAALDESKDRAEAVDRAIASIAGEPWAVETARDVLREFPNSLAIRIGLAYALIDEGSPEQAQAIFEEILQRSPDSVPGMVGLANLAFQRSDFVTSLRLIDRALESLRGKAATAREVATSLSFRLRLLIAIGDSRLDSKDFRGAADHFERVILDIGTLETLFPAGHRESSVEFTRAYYSLLARVGVGKAEVGLGHRARAVHALTLAQTYLPVIDRDGVDYGVSIRKLRELVDKSLYEATLMAIPAE